jgi:POT family proton-dependent oligopeptide transporter
LLIAVMLITIFQTLAYYQCFNVGVVWIADHVDVATPLGRIPVPWFNSIDAFFSVIAVPPLVWLWARQARSGREPSDMSKIGIGAAIAAVSAGLLALGALLAGDGKVSGLVPFVAFAGMGIAFLYYWPPMLALVSRAAPARVNATMVSGAYLSLFVGLSIMGWVGGFYERMTPAAFWALDAGIAATGALLVLLFGRALTRALATGDTGAG